MKKNKIIIGVSGGPDSTYLLTKLHNNNRYEPIAVHVNYHLREESNEDQNSFVEFCKKRNIPYFIKDVNKEDWEKYAYLGNKQSKARQMRYDIFFHIADRFNTKEIFIAHHKDDFIETALMQEKRSKNLLFYGIKKLSKFSSYRIHRPLLDIYKSEIIEYLNNEKISFRVDKTNFLPIYERNKLRLELSKLSIAEKDAIFDRFQKINEKNHKLEDEIERKYNEWRRIQFDYDFFNRDNFEVKKQLIYKMLILNEWRINITTDKLEGIIDFLKHKRGDKNYRLMENVFMTVENSKIVIYKSKVENGNGK
ncbi:MAG: tRNA(Ile)-lysidine synthase [Candidatus Tyloplasma litorale]|nr:MAG: tRNA(Ile)-lysidine synthase [Mycoplasmatales bacterium]